jgi:hypothetical protein
MGTCLRVAPALCILFAVSSLVLAGPNAGGVINVHDANCSYTRDNSTYCGLGQDPGDCDGIDVDLEGSSLGDPRVWKLYACFPPGSSPRLKALSFGIHYPQGEIAIVAHGECIGDPNNGTGPHDPPNWPRSDSGTWVVFVETQTTLLTEFYWFAGYSYHGNPALFQARDNPDPVLGGQFADDSIPAQLDSIACYGSMGFDSEGEACCFGPTPVEETTWGKLKGRFH